MADGHDHEMSPTLRAALEHRARCQGIKSGRMFAWHAWRLHIDSYGCMSSPERIGQTLDMSASAVLAELDSLAPREPTQPTRRDAELAALALGGNTQEKLQRFGATLAGRELEIFRDRIIAANPVTLKALGDRWSVCRERVRQLEKRIVTRLHDHNLLENP